MANIFNIGVSALNTFQNQLATTGHNIANVNTEGYSRQRVELATLPAQSNPAGYVGSGVQLVDIRRSFDQFLTENLRTSSSAYEESQYLHSRAVQIDNVIADPAAGLSQVMGDFFNAVHDVADDPTSIPAREVMLNQAEVLADRFVSLDRYLGDLRHQTHTDMANFVDQINRLSESVADLNQRILESGGAVHSTPPNDLLDQRDQLLTELSTFVNITTVTQQDGSINVFVGNGQPLVVGTGSNELVIQDSPASADIKTLSVRTPDGNLIEVTNVLSGGALGGVLRFQEEILDPAQNALGLTAIGLAGFFNEAHAAGMDLDGDLGEDFFFQAEPELLGFSTNSGTAAASFYDLSEVQADEYELRYDGASWLMIRSGTNQVVPMSGTGTAADPFLVEGVSIVIGPGAVAGDRYLLRPTRTGANEMEVFVKDPSDIAAAAPVFATEQTTNTGTGSISAGFLETRTGSTKLAAPITLTYDALLQEFNVSTGGTIPYVPAADSGATQTITIAGLGDFSFTINGTPANGDQFVIDDNTGAVGDNRNARRLADLQTQSLLLGSQATIAESYGFAVADVGTRTSRAATSLDVQKQLLDQALAARDEVSGVNLDEEAANLVQFQQSYQAAAQVIATANTLIDTLLGVVG